MLKWRKPKSYVRACVSLLTRLADTKTGDVRNKMEYAENPKKSRLRK